MGQYLIVDYKDIVNNQFSSLHYSDYWKDDINVNEGFKIVKLGNIVKFMPRSELPASEGKDQGKYNFYTLHKDGIRQLYATLG